MDKIISAFFLRRPETYLDDVEAEMTNHAGPLLEIASAFLMNIKAAINVGMVPYLLVLNASTGQRFQRHFTSELILTLLTDGLDETQKRDIAHRNASAKLS